MFRAMKVHFYKDSKQVRHPYASLCEFRGICGSTTTLHTDHRAVLEYAIKCDKVAMFTVDPGRVTCGRCKRSKIFPLLLLDSVEL